MNAHDLIEISPALGLALTAALERGGARVEAIGLPGQRAWLKRVETLAGVMRAQKGDPHKAIEAERAGLHMLGDLGLPVVPLLAEGPDWLLTRDCGPTVDSALLGGGMPEAGVTQMMRASGRALAQVHGAGFVHGRPVLRDICWDGAEARFIDLERFRARKAGPWRQALDMAILVQSWFARFPTETRGMDVAAGEWARLMAPDAQRKLVMLGWVLGWLGPATAPVRWLKPGSREFRALPLTLRYLRRFAGTVGQHQA